VLFLSEKFTVLTDHLMCADTNVEFQYDTARLALLKLDVVLFLIENVQSYYGTAPKNTQISAAIKILKLLA
jgi:hypothetical protein